MAQKRRRGAGTAIAAVVIIVIVAVAGALFFTGEFGAKSSISSGLSDLSKGEGLIQAQTSQIQISGVSLLADTFDGSKPLAPTCGLASQNSYISLTNSGSSSGGVASVTITYGGANNVFAVEGSCVLGPSGSASSTTFVVFPGPSALPNSTTPTASEPFLGTVNLSGGLHLPFSGTFEQGYPRVFVSSTSLVAAQLVSAPANATCAYSPPAQSSYFELTNNGTEGAQVTGISLGWNGTETSVPISGGCGLGPMGTASASVFISIDGVGNVSSKPVSGESYNLTVDLANGVAAPLTAETTASFR